MPGPRLAQSLTLLGAVFLSFAVAGASEAQTYPTKPIRLVVPFPPGGPTDVSARLVAQKAGEILKQPIVVDNVAGAGGTIGSAAVARTAPDGYTLLYGSSSTLGIAPSVYANLPYDPVASFAPVSLVASGPNVLFIHPKLPVNSVGELVDYAKRKPGELNYGSAGNGTPTHLAAEMFRVAAHIDAVHVPYKGGAPALTAVIAGDVHFAFDTVSAVVPHVGAGKVKVLGVAGAKRSQALPDVPTFAEAGLPSVNAASWNGIVAPAGVASDVVERLNAAVKEALANEEIVAKFAALGLEVSYTTPREFGGFIADEVKKWAAAAEKADVKPQ